MYSTINGDRCRTIIKKYIVIFLFKLLREKYTRANKEIILKKICYNMKILEPFKEKIDLFIYFM